MKRKEMFFLVWDGEVIEVKSAFLRLRILKEKCFFTKVLLVLSSCIHNFERILGLSFVS